MPPILGYQGMDVSEEAIEEGSFYDEDLGCEVYTGEEETSSMTRRRSAGISTYAAGGTTVVSSKNNVDGLVDYTNGSVQYILSAEDLSMTGATVEFQKKSGNSWVADGNSPFSFNRSAGKIMYHVSRGGGFGSAGRRISDHRVKITFPNAAYGSDGQYHAVTILLSNVYLWNDKDESADTVIFCETNGTASTGGEEEKHTSISLDVTVSVTGASSSDALFMMFYDIDIDREGYEPSTNYDDYRIDGRRIEAVKIKSGIYPGTQPHVPHDNMLVIKDGSQPEYYAYDRTDDMDSYRAAVSYLATATGTTYTWQGAGCETRIGIDMGYIPSFTVKTRVRTELASSPVTGTKTYEDYYDVNTKWFMKLMSINYSYTYSKSRLYSDKSLSASTDDWIFDFSGKTVGEEGISSNKVYSITINRNRYTYSFKPNPPVGKTASDISNMPTDKTVTASTAASGKSAATVKEPKLTGFWFMGWNTKADGTGTAYPGSETMKSDKVFYAQWKPATYVVHFNANGSVNPNHQTGEFTQNTTTGTMADQTLYFDQTENLNANKFKREGYTFAGWNTRSDGKGTAYTDKQAVKNLIGYDKSEITLYAQWTKKLGTETITVVSEETGNPVANVNMKLQKKVNGTWTDVKTGTTDSNGQIKTESLHWFDYRWEITGVPAGYVKSADTAFTITYNRLSAENTVILYLKHVQIILDSQVSDMIKGEAPPAFLYHIKGTDAAGVEHEYHLLVQTNISSRFGTNRIPDLFAGTYTVTQEPVSRYLPGTAANISNSIINEIHASVDVLNHESAEVRFPYTIREYGWYYGVSAVINHLAK